MHTKRKEWKQFIPGQLDKAWAFFSRPENLNEITPPGMSFEILSPITGATMYEGMIIQYKLSPFPGIRMDWVTEITHIQAKRYFVDEQRLGPYALWHHEHHFEEQDGGVLMTDLLHYKVPYGIIGAIAGALLVDRQIEYIFDYRRKAIAERFGEGG